MCMYCTKFTKDFGFYRVMIVTKLILRKKEDSRGLNIKKKKE